MIDIDAEFRKVVYGTAAANKLTESDKPLTMDMIREVAKKMGNPPPRQEIRCGNLDEFVAAIERRTSQTCLKVSKTYGVFAGIEVTVSPLVPVDKAVVFENGAAKSIIDLKEAD